MKDIFQYTNGDIKLASEDLLNVPEIKEIYTLKYNKGDGDHDGRKRLRFHNEIMYVFFFYSHKSSIIDYEDSERDKEAIRIAKLPKEFTPSEELTNFINWYKRHLENQPYLRALSVARTLVNTVITDMAKLKLGQSDTKFTDVMNSVSFLDKLLNDLTKLENSVKKNITATTRIYGDSKLGSRENPNNHKSYSQDDNELPSINPDNE